MTEYLIEPNDRKAGPYTAAANQKIFFYDYPVYYEEDLAVWHLPLGATASHRLTLGTDYTVTGVGAEAGGSIVLAAGASAGDIYQIVGSRIARRVTDFTQDGEFTAAALNQDLDLLAMAQQETQTQLAGVIRANPIDEDMDGTLPPAAQRANKWLGFDPDGNPVVGAPGTLALGPGDVTGDKIAANAVDSTKLATDAATQRPTRMARVFAATNLN